MKASFSSLFEDSPVIGSGIVAEAIAKHQEKRKEKLGALLVELVAAATDEKQSLVNLLRSIRADEKRVKDKIAKFARAESYFHATGNFGPLVNYVNFSGSMFSNLGVEPPTEDERKIPDDWQAP